jgi:hypothetical protein
MCERQPQCGAAGAGSTCLEAPSHLVGEMPTAMPRIRAVMDVNGSRLMEYLRAGVQRRHGEQAPHHTGSGDSLRESKRARYGSRKPFPSSSLAQLERRTSAEERVITEAGRCRRRVGALRNGVGSHSAPDDRLLRSAQRVYGLLASQWSTTGPPLLAHVRVFWTVARQQSNCTESIYQTTFGLELASSTEAN